MEPASSCRRTGKEECGGMLLANGAGREAPQSVAMWSHNHQMALPAQGRKSSKKRGTGTWEKLDLILGVSFVGLWLFLSLCTECLIPEQNHHLAAARRQQEQHLLSKYKLAEEYPAATLQNTARTPPFHPLPPNPATDRTREGSNLLEGWCPLILCDQQWLKTQCKSICCPTFVCSQQFLE